MMVKHTTEGYEYNIAATCREIRAHVTGSGEPLAAHVLAEYRGWLSMRLECWKPSAKPNALPGARAYDEAIRALIVATLAESA